jgi:hypothetical protein
MRILRAVIAAAAAASLAAGCAPDEFKSTPGFDGFLDRIGQVCYPDTIGPTLVREWAQGFGPGGGGAGFMNATSSLYYGKWTPLQYRNFITAMSDNGTATNKAIDCIIANLPAKQPGAPGGIPAGRDGVPPPPPSR